MEPAQELAQELQVVGTVALVVRMGYERAEWEVLHSGCAAGLEEDAGYDTEGWDDVYEVVGVVEVLVGRNPEAVDQLFRRARLEVEMIRSQEKLECQEVRRAAGEDLNQEYHQAGQ